MRNQILQELHAEYEQRQQENQQMIEITGQNRLNTGQYAE